MNNLYLPSGFFDDKYIFNKVVQKNVHTVLMLGSRQVGKTYVTLKIMLKNKLQHVLLRRTTDEFKMIAANIELSPYKVFEPDYKVGLFRQGDGICRICDYMLDEKGAVVPGDMRGIATSFAQISHMRGFFGGSFTDLVFDEFIPEKGVITRKTEGDSYLNAYTTINGNREISVPRRPPLRAWLLANSNRIDSPILDKLGIVDDILYMRRKGLEELITDTGEYIIQPASSKIIEARADTALMRSISKKSEFYRMAINNEFSYDESPYIKQISLKGARPSWSYDEYLYCWQKGDGFYICRAPFKSINAPAYASGATGRERLYLEHMYMKQYYYAGLVSFADLKLIADFKNLFNIA